LHGGLQLVELVGVGERVLEIGFRLFGFLEGVVERIRRLGEISGEFLGVFLLAALANAALGNGIVEAGLAFLGIAVEIIDALLEVLVAEARLGDGAGAANLC
jgi:hypothetical protein